MSRRDNNVDNGYIDTEFSSGDSNKMKSKTYQEENNNEVDELSKDLSEMGCIVDAVKRPPNICVETCVYESESEKSRASNEEDDYSDEFEDDKSEEGSVESQSKSAKSVLSREPTLSSVKLAKSQSSVSSNKPPGSISGRSTGFGCIDRRIHVGTLGAAGSQRFKTARSGKPRERSTLTNHFWADSSVSIPSSRRINMSFTNERLREIERHNHILLSKILSARNIRKSSIPPREQPIRKPVPSAAVTRKNQQRQIDHDNMILLKKIQRAKSSAYSIRR